MKHTTRSTYTHQEINFHELLSLLTKQKWLILFITALSMLLGSAYLIFTKPIYEVNAFISAPYAVDIDAINYGKTFPDDLLKPFKAEAVYSIFKKALFAQTLNPVFKDSIKMNKIPRSDPEEFIIRVRGYKATELVEVMHHYINLVNNQAKKNIMDMVMQRQQIILKELQQQINSAKMSAKKNTSDRLARVKEALNIAQAANLLTPMIQKNMRDDGEKPSLMYARGSKALRAEVENLKHRKLGIAFFPELREFQKKYDLYKKIPVAMEDFQMFHLDNVIETPKWPIGPDKKLILTASILIGLMLGVLIGIMRSIFQGTI